MEMHIKTVTITGADDSIEPSSLIELSTEFPFVEWGILLSESQNGGTRFPNKPWIKQLYWECSQFDYVPQTIRVSAHVCGIWVRELLKGNDNNLFAFLGDSKNMFSRIQLNTHASVHQVNHKFKEMVRVWLAMREIIVQFDGINDCLYDLLKGWNIDVRPLFDLSGGAGIVPNEWPCPIDEYTGYAGGLSPDNLKEELQKIETVVGDGTIWIDMETRVRSNNDETFDLDKVRKCLTISSNYIGK